MAFGDSLLSWCSAHFKGLLAHVGLTSEDGLLSFTKVCTLIVAFMPMTNTKAILVIASAHGTKMLMALIDKTTLGLNSTDTTTSTNSTTTTKTYAYASPTQVAADKAFEGEFVDPDGNPSTNPDTGGTDEGK